VKEKFYRRSPDVMAYWDDEGLVLENYLAHTRVGVAPVAALLLSALDRWRRGREVCRAFPDFDRASVLECVELLAQHKFLDVAAGRKPKDPPAKVWPEWSPAAAQFHFSTKDARFTSDPAKEMEFYRARARAWPIPRAVKRQPSAPQIRLPRPKRADRFSRVLLARRTWRRFSAAPLSLAHLSELLQRTWGVQQWMQWPVLGKLPRKTSPSGGARHPVEAYVVALRVKDLPRGIYHYAADRHRLERVRNSASPEMVDAFFPSQWWYRDAAVIFLMTAVFPRTQWKYPSPRSYRVVLADAGHLGQTFCLVATWLGLAPFCTMALADTKIEQALGVDGISESVVYATGVGVRPQDGRDPGDLPGQISAKVRPVLIG